MAWLSRGLVILLAMTSVVVGNEPNDVSRLLSSEQGQQTRLHSEIGEDSRIRLLHIDGGRDAKFVIAFRNVAFRGNGIRNESLLRFVETPWTSPPVAEWLWPTRQLIPTDIVYDCTEEVLHGKAKPILCDLRKAAIRVFAIVPTQVEHIEISGPATVMAGDSISANIEFQDAGRKRLFALLPFHVAVYRQEGERLDGRYLATAVDGMGRFSLHLPADTAPGKLRLVVRSQLNGLTSTLPIEILMSNPLRLKEP